MGQVVNCLKAACTIAVHQVISGTASPSVLLFGDTYVPRANDTYVQADAGACCVGMYPSLTINYFAQTFRATCVMPDSITLGLANNFGGGAVPGPSFRYRLLFADFANHGPGLSLGPVLWESGDQSIPGNVGGYNELTFALSGFALDVGSLYAWLLDTYTPWDGLADAGAFYANVGINAPAYNQGSAYSQQASGLGQATDFTGSCVTGQSDIPYRPALGLWALTTIEPACLEVPKREKQPRLTIAPDPSRRFDSHAH